MIYYATCFGLSVYPSCSPLYRAGETRFDLRTLTFDLQRADVVEITDALDLTERTLASARSDVLSFGSRRCWREDGVVFGTKVRRCSLQAEARVLSPFGTPVISTTSAPRGSEVKVTDRARR